MRAGTEHNSDHYILGDWGTSNLRVYLCDRDNQIVDTLLGSGIADVQTQAADYFFELIAAWREQYGALDITLSGMAGSNIGWHEASYLMCPLILSKILNALTSFSARGHNVTIIPGLKTVNPFDAPDVMRGEETQIVGAFAIKPELKEGSHILCLPGTHTKWVFVLNGKIETFFTAVSGELFALFRKHSVLVKRHEGTAPTEDAAFEQGTLRAKELSPVALLHMIFEVRSRQLVGELTHLDAVSYLSGLVIGRDIAGAIPVYANEGSSIPITIVGTDQLAQLYAIGCRQHGYDVSVLSGVEASQHGLMNVYSRFSKAAL